MTRRTRIKVCGVTRPDDARMAASLGVDAIGLNFHPKSSRFVSDDLAREIVQAIGPSLEIVGVFVDSSTVDVNDRVRRTGASAVQLHGDETCDSIAGLSVERVIKAFRWAGDETKRAIERYVDSCRRLTSKLTSVLIDSYTVGMAGGSGRSWPWRELGDWPRPLPVIIAGGLALGNVREAIRFTTPFAVDVASGVEASPGIKDYDKLAQFVEAVRAADAAL